MLQEATVSERTQRIQRALVKVFLNENQNSDDSLGSKVSLQDVLQDSDRRKAARMYLEVLTLGTRGFLSVRQDQPYGSIVLAPTPLIFKTVE